MNFEFSDRQREVYEIVGFLARERFQAREAEHDRDMTLPLDNLRDLHERGLLGLTIARERGGMGSGVMGDDPVLYLLALEQTARVSLSTAHCLHIHLHITHFVDQVCGDEQRERFLGPVLERGALWSGIGSEPGRTARGIYNLETTAQPVGDGYVVNGRKNYATLAGAAEFNAVFAVIPGSPVPDGHVCLAIPNGARGFEVVPGSWNPMGMRAAVSPDVRIENCLVPGANLVGAPGVYARERWQARHYLALAVQCLGGCEGIFDALTEYLPRRKTTRELFTQLRLGEIRVLIDSLRWMIYRSAWLWTRRDLEQAEVFSLEAKHQAVRATGEVMEKAAQVAGSSAFLDDAPLTRLFRDLRMHTLHSSLDKMAATVGKFHLGESFDTTDRL